MWRYIHQRQVVMYTEKNENIDDERIYKTIFLRTSSRSATHSTLKKIYMYKWKTQNHHFSPTNIHFGATSLSQTRGSSSTTPKTKNDELMMKKFSDFHRTSYECIAGKFCGVGVIIKVKCSLLHKKKKHKIFKKIKEKHKKMAKNINNTQFSSSFNGFALLGK